MLLGLFQGFRELLEFKLFLLTNLYVNLGAHHKIRGGGDGGGAATANKAMPPIFQPDSSSLKLHPL